MAILSIIGFIVHRIMIDQRSKDNDLKAAIDIIVSSKDGLEGFTSLLESEEK